MSRFPHYNDYVVGALAGGNDGVIERCVVSGSVFSKNADYMGGLVGFNTYTGVVSESYANCRVSGGNDKADVGGLIGVQKDGIVQDCYASCVLSAQYRVGGLVGYFETYRDTGIVHCYAVSTVTDANTLWGGLVGWVGYPYEIDANQIDSSYFLLSGDGMNNNGLGTPLTSVQMVQPDSFVDWDFWRVGRTDTAWIMRTDGMPCLIWQVLKAFQDSEAISCLVPRRSCDQQ